MGRLAAGILGLALGAAVMALAPAKLAAQPAEEITDANFQARVIEPSKTGPVVVFFTLDGCTNCADARPVLDRIAARDHLSVAVVDVIKGQSAVGFTNLLGLPLVVIYRDGKQAEKISGDFVADKLEMFLSPLKPAAK